MERRRSAQGRMTPQKKKRSISEKKLATRGKKFGMGVEK